MADDRQLPLFADLAVSDAERAERLIGDILITAFDAGRMVTLGELRGAVADACGALAVVRAMLADGRLVLAVRRRGVLHARRADRDPDEGRRVFMSGDPRLGRRAEL